APRRQSRRFTSRVKAIDNSSDTRIISRHPTAPPSGRASQSPIRTVRVYPNRSASTAARIAPSDRADQGVRVGYYEDQVLPRAINVMLGNRECRKLRTRAVAGLEGEVLEIGFGSGLNVPLYPDAVTKVLAVDPATVGRKLAADRVAASPIPVEYV